MLRCKKIQMTFLLYTEYHFHWLLSSLNKEALIWYKILFNFNKSRMKDKYIHTVLQLYFASQLA